MTESLGLERFQILTTRVRDIPLVPASQLSKPATLLEIFDHR
jgi:hypothetical protein